MAAAIALVTGGPALAFACSSSAFVRLSLERAAEVVSPHLERVLAKNTECSPADILAMIEAGTLTAIGMYRFGRLVGFGLVQAHDTPSGRWLHDAHVWVLPEYRRQGFYTAYIEHLKRWASREGWLGVKCLVHADEDEEIWQKTLPALGGQRRTVEYVFPVGKEG